MLPPWFGMSKIFSDERLYHVVAANAQIYADLISGANAPNVQAPQPAPLVAFPAEGTLYTISSINGASLVLVYCGAVRIFKQKELIDFTLRPHDCVRP